MAFILPTAQFHAVLTFGQSLQSRVPVCIASDWDIAKRMIRWQLDLPKKMKGKRAEPVMQLLEEMKPVVKVWRELAEKLYRPGGTWKELQMGANIIGDIGAIEKEMFELCP